jgi:kynureninase
MATALDEKELLAARAHFPGLAECVHLVSHSLGAMPRRARQEVTRFFEQWEDESIGAWHEHWLPAVDALAATIARVVSAPASSICLHQNVSTLQSIVASCFDFQDTARRRVILSELDFPTIHYLWHEQSRRGAEVVMVSGEGGPRAAEERLLLAIDERTAIVPLSHVLFGSSAVVDVARVAERARKFGARVLVDCYQSACTVPVDASAWGVDFACGGSVKWACGGPGVAWLYVAPHALHELRPAATGWFAHRAPFAFQPGPIEYADHIWKFVGGTPPVIPIYTARAGWELIADIGVDRIRAKSLRQTKLLLDWALARGFRLVTPTADAERGGTVCFDFTGSETASRWLLEHRFFHDRRPASGLRVSPHFYTADEELELFMREVDRLAPRVSRISALPPGSSGARTVAS